MKTTKICSKCNMEKSINQFNRDKQKTCGYRPSCKECNRDIQKKHRDINKDKTRKYNKKYQIENSESLKEYNKEYRSSNFHELSIKKKIYISNNRDIIFERERKYRNTLNGKIVKRKSELKRRALKANSKIYNFDIKDLISKSKNCYWCECVLDKKSKCGYHIDHYVPLSKGGTHALDNLVVTCPKCNLTKSAKMPLIFANSIGKLL